MNQLLQRMYDFRPRVAVMGDAMIDEYYDVRADKVSPEFPIPILRSFDGLPHCVRPGGAANVCAQMVNFNVDVSLFALTNERLKRSLRGVNADLSIFSKSVPVKRRYYSDGFPLCRMDVEGKEYRLEPASINELRHKLLRNLSSSGPYDVVVFSDYDKGIFSDDLNPLSMAGDAITIVDPKRGSLDRWTGCSIIKPNSAEARELTGLTEWRDQCSYLMDSLRCQAVVITQQGEGVVGNVQGAWFEYRPESATQASSVIGAGDCFVAFLAMCMCHSIDIRVAVEIAFNACATYVKQRHNSPIWPYNLIEDKFVDPRILSPRDFCLSFANGCFDILHPGHLELLKFARSKADGLVVALNTDDSVARQGKAHPLVNDLAYRKTMVAALECVDFVVEFDEDTPIELIRRIKPDILVKGSDWKDPVGAELVSETHSFELFGDHSTTSIINKISDLVG